MNKKILTLLLVSSFIASALSGCVNTGSNTDTNKPGVETETSTDTNDTTIGDSENSENITNSEIVGTDTENGTNLEDTTESENFAEYDTSVDQEEPPESDASTELENPTDTENDTEIVNPTESESPSNPETEETGHVHQYSLEWRSAETGHWKSCACGEAVIEWAVHEYGDWEVTREATEEERGRKERICKICSYVDVTWTSKLKHVHSNDGDWLSSGTVHWYICRCGERQEEVHSYSEWEVILPPTCQQTGLKMQYCSVCNYYITEKIPTSDHIFTDYIYDNNATYLEDGTETATCENCEVQTCRIAIGTKLQYTCTDMSAILYARKPTKARTVPSSEGDEICSIAEGEAVTVTGYCNETGWYRIEYEGQIGYVHHRHLTEEFSE